MLWRRQTPRSMTSSPLVATNGTSPVPRSKRWIIRGARLASTYGTLGALVIMIAVFTLLSPGVFLTRGNFIDILSDIAIGAVIACGLTIPMVTGEFDLSIGYVGSFAGVLVTGFVVQQHMSLLVGVVATIGVCAAIGITNGLIVTKVGVSSFIATLGAGTVVQGLNYGYNSGIPITLGVPQSFLNINLKRILGIPLPVYIAAAIVFALWLLLNHTLFGYNAQAIGQNAEAAHLAGIRVDRVRLQSLIVSSVCAGIGGILLATKLGSGQNTAADGYLLTAFAAAFLGSVALRDSEFHIVGTVIGVLTVGVAFNGLAVISAPTFWQYVVQGGLLVAAVALSTIGRRLLAGR